MEDCLFKDETNLKTPSENLLIAIALRFKILGPPNKNVLRRAC